MESREESTEQKIRSKMLKLHVLQANMERNLTPGCMLSSTLLDGYIVLLYVGDGVTLRCENTNAKLVCHWVTSAIHWNNGCILESCVTDLNPGRMFVHSFKRLCVGLIIGKNAVFWVASDGGSWVETFNNDRYFTSLRDFYEFYKEDITFLWHDKQATTGRCFHNLYEWLDRDNSSWCNPLDCTS